MLKHNEENVENVYLNRCLMPQQWQKIIHLIHMQNVPKNLLRV